MMLLVLTLCVIPWSHATISRLTQITSFCLSVPRKIRLIYASLKNFRKTTKLHFGISLEYSLTKSHFVILCYLTLFSYAKR